MNQTEYLLTCLIEECSEVIKKCTKSLRFGLRDDNPKTKITNGQEVAGELECVLARASMLVRVGLIPPFTNRDAIDAKVRKERKYMEYSRKKGTLKDGDT